jgi:hypothetical protein
MPICNHSDSQSEAGEVNMAMSKAIYVAYLTGVAGQSIGLFYIGDGVIAGVDAGTMKYEGSYAVLDDGSLEGAIEYVLPPGVPLITGAPSGVAPARVTLKLGLPAGFDDGRVVAIETPLGPVNAKFEKIKEIP